ncbi:hypothetical protein, variant 1 [Aphanomyces invadans]|uniref:FCH domain-containing protein n=1 Tax=Aphanomyces invadans TaxID=157072 RepID=A0A024U0X7_9STRA|nr:hypothetical protein, variant 1 [Aphanomyces invadans]ETV99551.1 hypothetical protein, variant 1 [Aphanomyces invadans]|eukprot:XP_008872107.1 hypothetical protein, variant 1 [Aphanomyces invadans]
MSTDTNAMPSPPPSSLPRDIAVEDLESKPPAPVSSVDQVETTISASALPPSQGETTPSNSISSPPPTSPSTTTSLVPAKVTLSSASALVACESLSMTSPRHAASSPPPSGSTSPRSNSFTKSSPHDKHMSPAMEWRNKSVSCDALRGFETSRKTYIDPGQSADRRYWELFCQEIQAGREHNARLVKFFTLKVQADLAYADSLRRLRLVLDSPHADVPAATASSSSKGSKLNLQAASSCDQALSALGENQQLLCEKIEMFTNAVQRDVVARPFQEMITKYEETVTTMLTEGEHLDTLLHLTQRRVQEAFAVYDGVFRDMERHRHAKDPTHRGGDKESTSSHDLWLAEMTYGMHVKRLQNVRVEYVKGMAALFHQLKTLEVLRVSVTQSALDNFLRKQKLIFEELGNSMAEPLAIVQKIEPEKDLIQTIRRIPRNNTALALASETQEAEFFSSFRSPLASPLVRPLLPQYFDWRLVGLFVLNGNICMDTCDADREANCDG